MRFIPTEPSKYSNSMPVAPAKVDGNCVEEKATGGAGIPVPDTRELVGLWLVKVSGIPVPDNL